VEGEKRRKRVGGTGGGREGKGGEINGARGKCEDSRGRVDEETSIVIF
jgi:hypothetical protein